MNTGIPLFRTVFKRNTVKHGHFNGVPVFGIPMDILIMRAVRIACQY